MLDYSRQNIYIKATIKLLQQSIVVIASLLAFNSLSAQDLTDYISDRDIIRQLYEEVDEIIVKKNQQVALTSETLSIKRNAKIKIGGEFWTSIKVVNTDVPANLLPNKDYQSRMPHSQIRTSDFNIERARLFFDVRINDRWRSFISAELTDSKNDYTGSSAQIREAYIEMQKASYSGIGLKVGKIRLPFSINKPELMLESYSDRPNLQASSIMSPFAAEYNYPMPHAAIKTTDPVMAAVVSYEARDIIKAELSLFQDNAGRKASLYSHDRHGLSWKTEDPMFRSFAAKLGFYPLDAWELSVGFRNRFNNQRNINYWADNYFRSDFLKNISYGHNDPYWDSTTGTWSNSYTSGERFGSKKNEQALTAGFMLEIPNTGISLFAEYLRGFNQGFNKHIASHNVNAGLAVKITSSLKISLQGEWLRVNDKSWLTRIDTSLAWRRDYYKSTLMRSLLAVEYELSTGAIIEAGWQYETLRTQAKYGKVYNVDRLLKAKANTFYLGTKFEF